MGSKRHFWISMVKSVIRIAACSFIVVGNLVVGGVLFGVAELLGIAEEIFDERGTQNDKGVRKTNYIRF